MASKTEQQTQFLGRTYNYVDWVVTTRERNLFKTGVARAGDIAPDFTLPDMESGELTLSDLRGKPVMIEFGSIT